MYLHQREVEEDRPFPASVYTLFDAGLDIKDTVHDLQLINEIKPLKMFHKNLI